jgi:hypothetical protein
MDPDPATVFILRAEAANLTRDGEKTPAQEELITAALEVVLAGHSEKDIIDRIMPKGSKLKAISDNSSVASEDTDCGSETASGSRFNLPNVDKAIGRPITNGSKYCNHIPKHLSKLGDVSYIWEAQLWITGVLSNMYVKRQQSLYKLKCHQQRSHHQAGKT